MKINNLLLFLGICSLLFSKGYETKFIPKINGLNINVLQHGTSVPNYRTDFPYIENGILYTKTKAISINTIKRIDLNDEGIRFFVITYELNKYCGGMIALSGYNFQKIEKQLLGETYEEKSKKDKKKNSNSFFDQICN